MLDRIPDLSVSEIDQGFDLTVFGLLPRNHESVLCRKKDQVIELYIQDIPVMSSRREALKTGE